MHLSALFVTGLVGTGVAEIFSFPLPNGFPDLTSDEALRAVEKQAGGPLPVSPSSFGGSSPPSTAYPALQAVAFNEIFEVAFFTQVLQNITKNLPGYQLHGDDAGQIIASLNASQAQEQLHAIQANYPLVGNKQYPPATACKYQFPVDNFQDAMKIADDFTTLITGAIAQFTLALGGGQDIVPVLDAIQGQEGQQTGYMRWVQKKIPNQAAYLSSADLSFLINHINQNYVVPGSCSQELDIPTFYPMTTCDTPPAKNSTIKFKTTQPNVSQDHYVMYFSGQLKPVVVPISDIKTQKDGTEFHASFPYDLGFSRGLTIATLTNITSPPKIAADVAKFVTAGPALIHVYYE